MIYVSCLLGFVSSATIQDSKSEGWDNSDESETASELQLPTDWETFGFRSWEKSYLQSSEWESRFLEGIGLSEKGGQPFLRKWPKGRKPAPVAMLDPQTLVEASRWPLVATKLALEAASSLGGRSLLLSGKCLTTQSHFSGLDCQVRAAKILEASRCGVTFDVVSSCEIKPDCRCLLQKDFPQACAFKNVLDKLQPESRQKLMAAASIDEITQVLDSASWQTTAPCSSHGQCSIPMMVDLNMYGSPCTDDSRQGSQRQDMGNTRRVAYLHCLFVISVVAFSLCVGFLGTRARKVGKHGKSYVWPRLR
jgi:hypothetical protein